MKEIKIDHNKEKKMFRITAHLEDVKFQIIVTEDLIEAAKKKTYGYRLVKKEPTKKDGSLIASDCYINVVEV